MKFNVRVTREGSSWLADVDHVPGAATFAGNLVALEAAVREVLSLLLDIDDESVFEFTFEFSNPDAELLAARELGDRRLQLEHELEDLALQTARHIKALARQNYSMRDISALLHISPGRVSQIAKSTNKVTV